MIRKIKVLGFLMIFLVSNSLKAQELFPLTEPASTIPTGVIGVRLFTETYKEWVQWRNITGLRVMYGATPNLSLYVTAFGSNHHGEKLPVDFPFHNSPERGGTYPYLFNGASLYAKYRFLSIDKQNEHFRMAAYGEGTYVDVTHHEAEPNVNMGDNAGFGAGIISTYLYQKFAVSLQLGATIPTGYTGVTPDLISNLPDIPLYVKYGNSLDYRLSFGYLLYPQKYKSFDQTNINLYLELTGKKYDATIVRVFNKQDNEYWLNNYQYPIGLQKGAFLDISAGAQAIIKSNMRVEFAVTFPFLGISYAKLYPVYTVGIQHYFFR